MSKKIATLAGFNVRRDLDETARILNIFINKDPNSLWAIRWIE